MCIQVSDEWWVCWRGNTNIYKNIWYTFRRCWIVIAWVARSMTFNRSKETNRHWWNVERMVWEWHGTLVHIHGCNMSCCVDRIVGITWELNSLNGPSWHSSILVYYAFWRCWIVSAWEGQAIGVQAFQTSWPSMTSHWMGSVGTTHDINSHGQVQWARMARTQT